MTCASICTIGDEILIGQIVDTNSSHISQALNTLGIKVTRMLSIGDDHDTIVNALKGELSTNDIVIVTGGLGPTKDDIMMFEWMNDANIPYFIVATKSDKLNATNKKVALESLRSCEFISPDAEIIEFSALKKTGKDEVWQKIISML